MSAVLECDNIKVSRIRTGGVYISNNRYRQPAGIKVENKDFMDNIVNILIFLRYLNNNILKLKLWLLQRH